MVEKNKGQVKQSGSSNVEIAKEDDFYSFFDDLEDLEGIVDDEDDFYDSFDEDDDLFGEEDDEFDDEYENEVYGDDDDFFDFLEDDEDDLEEDLLEEDEDLPFSDVIDLILHNAGAFADMIDGMPAEAMKDLFFDWDEEDEYDYYEDEDEEEDNDKPTFRKKSKKQQLSRKGSRKRRW